MTFTALTGAVSHFAISGKPDLWIMVLCVLFTFVWARTIKTLRYYEKEGLLIPAFIDENTGYRFYETSQLPELAKIISLRQIGLSINNIKNILNSSDLEQILKLRKQELENEISMSSSQLLQINNLLEGKSMEHEVIIKELPSYIVYYKEGVVKDFSEIVKFILQSSSNRNRNAK